MKRDTRVLIGKVASRFDILLSDEIKNPKLYYTANPYSSDETYLTDIVGNEIVIEDPDLPKRTYFIIKSDNTPDILASTRKVDVPEVENFRDQGGYRAVNGKHVKWGRFFRGGSFSAVKDDGKAYLDSMGIKNIYDYRDIDEAGLAPDYVPSGTNYHLTPAMKKDPFEKLGVGDHAEVGDAKVHLTIEEYMSEIETKEEYEAAIAGFHMLYESLPFDNPAYKEMLDSLDSEDTAVIYQHCSAGKDRTGVGCMMLLMALGVDRDTAVGDYLLSAAYREDTNKALFETIKHKVTNEYAEKLFTRMMSVERGFIESTLSAIDKKYDSFEAFLAGEYNITDKRLAHWRSIHLV